MPNLSAYGSNPDQQAVERLLGRPARVPFTVLKRCPDGSPQVVQAEPVFQEDGIWKPFPTIYWLLCPKLRLAISHLEQGGFLKSMLSRLEQDSAFREAFLRGQSAVCECRVRRAAQILPQPLSENMAKVLRETSIAGSHHLLGLKCLHAHAAHTLAGGENPVGEAILAATGSCDGIHQESTGGGATE
ncbi:MAG TPA: DUF501 domain-containing protein [Candidatus Ozemobacteraceae bacterium]|nr:DUF501 domain-containing protein [Candidatus Ozemobacteraceae bacterium]